MAAVRIPQKITTPLKLALNKPSILRLLLNSTLSTHYPWAHGWLNRCRACGFTTITPLPRERCDHCWRVSTLQVKPVDFKVTRGFCVNPGKENMKRRPRLSGSGFTSYDPDDAGIPATKQYLRKEADLNERIREVLLRQGETLRARHG
jgi:hypothetical protein